MAATRLYNASQRMRDLIDDNPVILMALSRFGISLGFGDHTVAEICKSQNVDAQTFLAVVNFISFGEVGDVTISLSSMMFYLENAHDYFLNFCLPRIRSRLIEAIDCSGRDRLAMLVMKFYDSYIDEVYRHMDHENKVVFGYVRSLIDRKPNPAYNIAVFASGHHSIHTKLQELKDIIIRYLPQRNNNLLNQVLYDIIACENDLMTHCKVEDAIFVPAVKLLEEQVENEAEFEVEVDGSADLYADNQLSSREREIVACVARSMSNKEIADKLCLSVNTVTTHRRNIAQKLEIRSAAGLAIYAVVNGLVDIGELS